MRIDALLPRDCGTCPTPPPCNCQDNQDCVYINRDCETPCPIVTCVPKADGTSGSSGGPNKAAIAGGVVGALIFISIVVCLFLWYRRSPRFGRAREAGVEAKPDVPAPAAAVLSRPDPTEKPPSSIQRSNTVRVYSSSSQTTIDLDPQSQRSTPHPGYEPSTGSSAANPFEDQNSIQTAGTEGTNVIPIALVTPGSQRSSLQSESRSGASAGPLRPQRAPDDNLNDHLNLEHVNVSNDSFRPGGNYAKSQISGVSAATSRNSYMSGASYSSDLLNEAPMIITPKRQVLGVGKAEVINAPTRGADGTLLKPPATGTKPVVRSPLSATSFSPGDTDSVNSGNEEDPFSDRHVSTQTNLATSPALSRMTFGQRAGDRQSNATNASEWGTDGPLLAWTQGGDQGSTTRPSSMSTQAGSVIDIASATRVNLGFSRANSGASSGQRTLYRTTMGRLVTPSTGSSSSGDGSLEEQQRQAYADVQQSDGSSTPMNRLSDSTMASGFSARADSILEAFPFVPPSPISNRPARSPPVSPLSKHVFSDPSTPRNQQTFSDLGSPTVTEQPTPTQTKAPSNPLMDDDEELAPPNRKMLGMSTSSQLSTASSGLGSFDFQIDHGDQNRESTAPTPASAPPSSFNATSPSHVARHRASLDTLAITSDLSSYPLAIDSKVPPLPPKAKQS